MSTGNILTALAAAPGIIALVWRAYDELSAYLKIDIRVKACEKEWLLLRCVVRNDGRRTRELKWACILVGPESESPLCTVKSLLPILQEKFCVPQQTEIMYLNDLVKLEGLRDPVFLTTAGRGLLPLPFFYSENVAISDETVSYEVPIPIGGFPSNQPYSARLFLFPKSRLHRTSQACFVTPKSDAP